MSDWKAKLPDLGELGGMAGKLFKDVKKSVCEIAKTYKDKHADPKASTSKTKKPKAEASKKESK